MKNLPDLLNDAKRRFESAKDTAEEHLVDALANTFEHVTGKRPSETVIDNLRGAVRFTV